MFRLLFRLISLFLFAFALIYGVIDASKTISASGLVFTSFEATLYQLLPDQIDQFSAWVQQAAPAFVNEVLLATLYKIPTFLVATLLALLFYVMSHKSKRAIGRFSLD